MHSTKYFTFGRVARFASLAAVTAAFAAALAGQASAASSSGPPDLVERWVLSHNPQVSSSGPPDLVERWVLSHKAQVLAPDDMSRVLPKPAPSHFTAAGLKADGLRLQAMADAYRNRPASSYYTAQALRAQGLRMVAMAKAYEREQSQTVATSNSGAGFDWRDGLIGAAGAVGLAILAMGPLVIAARSRREQVPA
jgi:hypothetical protein